MTELLFRKDPHLSGEFEAKVVSTERENDFLLVELDRTAFHPQGAGQVSDTGEISAGSGTGKVADVTEAEGRILHKITGLENLSGTVKCKMDWPRRQRLSALHTGEHVLMASLIRLGRGFDLDKILIDENGGKLFVSGEVSLRDVAEAEKMANSAIRERRPVRFHLFESVGEAREKFPALRIKEEKVAGRPLRVVEVEGFDASACSGTHAANTAEVGVVKVFWLNRHHSGSSILEFDVGEKAVERMVALSNSALEVSEALGTEPHKSAKAALNLKLKAKSLYDNLRRVGKIAASSVRIEAIAIGELKLYSANLSGMADKEDVLKIGKSLVAKEPKGVAVLLGGFEEPFFVVCARGSSVSADMKALASEVCAILGGGSGGKPDFATGAGRNAEKIEEALSAAKKQLSGYSSPKPSSVSG